MWIIVWVMCTYKWTIFCALSHFYEVLFTVPHEIICFMASSLRWCKQYCRTLSYWLERVLMHQGRWMCWMIKFVEKYPYDYLFQLQFCSLEQFSLCSNAKLISHECVDLQERTSPNLPSLWSAHLTMDKWYEICHSNSVRVCFVVQLGCGVVLLENSIIKKKSFLARLHVENTSLVLWCEKPWQSPNTPLHMITVNLPEF